MVTGCLMQRYREELMKELPEVDLFTGVGDYERIDEMILKKQIYFQIRLICKVKILNVLSQVQIPMLL